MRFSTGSSTQNNKKHLQKNNISSVGAYLTNLVNNSFYITFGFLTICNSYPKALTILANSFKDGL